MVETSPAREKGARPLLHGAVAAVGICIFGLIINCPIPWTLLAGAALLASAVTIGHSFLREGNPPIILGLKPFSGKAIPSLVLGCAFGIVLGILFRFYSDLPLFPEAVGWFVIVAVGIGATEELLYRGYIQGRFSVLGWLLAPLLAAAAHTLYKIALFVSPPAGVAIDYAVLVAGTFLAGIVFGLLREWSGNVLPPLAGHVLFDIIVYGENAHAPWWVWT